MDVVIENLPRLIDGFLLTLRLLLISGAGALVLGLVIAAMRISPVAAFRVFATGYTELLRNTPLTLVLFFCAYLLPNLGVRFTSEVSVQYEILAIIGLIAYTSPFVAEAIRSGINGVPLGQAEAARAVGLTFSQVLTLIVLPQAVRMVIPPLVNVLIALTKNTSVAAAFSVIELVAVSRQIIQQQGQAIAILLAVAVFYLVITVPLGRLAAYLEQRVQVLR